MIIISRRTQYALRALLELAKRQGDGPIKVSEIADAQFIPLRFLEVILGQLRRAGMVISKRGYHGGYVLNRPPEDITVGEVLRYIQKSATPDQCIACETKKICPFLGECVFQPMWKQVKTAIFDIYDRTTIQDLLATQSRSLTSKSNNLDKKSRQIRK